MNENNGGFLALLGMTQRRGFLAITLTFDSSPIKGEGDLWLVLSCCLPRPVDTAVKPV